MQRGLEPSMMNEISSILIQILMTTCNSYPLSHYDHYNYLLRTLVAWREEEMHSGVTSFFKFYIRT